MRAALSRFEARSPRLFALALILSADAILAATLNLAWGIAK